jgi:hypothetical protein
VTEESVNNHKGYSILLLGIVSAILAMPLFILLYKYFPSIEIPIGENELRLDHIILFLGIFFLTYYLVKKFRILVYITVVGGLVGLTVTNFSGIYTLDNLYHDYAQFLYDLSENSLRQKFESQKTIFKQEKELREAIDYKNPDVRNYAASIAIKNFEDKAYLSSNRKWVQFFSVFKEINNNWKYVYDPINEDYYSSGSNTLKQLQFDGKFKGDCDDYSIMMASCIKAIGGEVRLVRTVIESKEGNRIGHMYPEVKFGDEKDLETVVYLIKNIFFVEEALGKSIFYFEDSKGFVWLNFDYNDRYPGGKYQSEIRESEITI